MGEKSLRNEMYDVFMNLIYYVVLFYFYKIKNCNKKKKKIVVKQFKYLNN